MAIKPILFNTEMVRAILDGRKSCTRRINKDANDYVVPDMDFYDSDKRTYAVHNYANKEHTDKLSIAERTCPICQGDILYVRETWRVGAWDIFNQMIAFDYKDGTCGELNYIHDQELFERLVNQSREDSRKAKCDYNGVDFVWEKGKSPCRWHPSIHMPKEAARIWLKVTDVRIERLQDVTEDGAKAEGVIDNRGFIHSPENEYDRIHTAREHFIKIWNSTIKKSDLNRYGWDANPWVWVISFERCEKPEGVKK